MFNKIINFIVKLWATGTYTYVSVLHFTFAFIKLLPARIDYGLRLGFNDRMATASLSTVVSNPTHKNVLHDPRI